MKKFNLSALLLGAGLLMAMGVTTLSADAKDKTCTSCVGEKKASKAAEKCGAGKCGADKKAPKAAEKCGAGKCGDDKKAPKAAEKCGAGKCS